MSRIVWSGGGTAESKECGECVGMRPERIVPSPDRFPGAGFAHEGWILIPAGIP
mgnify:CR=1 FL=1